MGSNPKDIIDFDFDPDILANYLQKLNLEPTIPDLSASLGILENETEDIQLLNVDEVCAVKYLSHEEDFKSNSLSNKQFENISNTYVEITNEKSLAVKSTIGHIPSNDIRTANISIKKEVDDNEICDFGEIEALNGISQVKDNTVLDKFSGIASKDYVKFEIVDSIKASGDLALNNRSSEDVTFPAVLIKKELTDDKIYNFVKSEAVSDSDDEDENLPSLLERGPDKIKKRSCKRKQYERKSQSNHNTDAPIFDQHLLLFLSSGNIIQNNCINSLPSSQIERGFVNIDSNYPNNNCINSLPSSQIESGFVNIDSNYPNNCINSLPSSQIESGIVKLDSNSINLFANSPESGYDTSQSCGLYSPASSFTDSSLQSLNDVETFDDDAFFDFLLDLGKSLESTTAQVRDCNIPILDDNDCDYIEQLKNYFKETVENHESLHLTEEVPSYEIACTETSSNAVASVIPLDTSSRTIAKNIGRKISYELKDTAKNRLRFSESFDVDKYVNEQNILFQEIQEKERDGKTIKIIDYEEPQENDNIKRSNLHTAVKDSNFEKVYCLVEAQKRYKLPLFDINIRDSSLKTPLDYAVKQNLPLIIAYLKENNAVEGI